MMKALGILCVLTLVATGAFGQMLEDFESGNPFALGSIVADPDNAANNVLSLGGNDDVTLALPSTLAAGKAVQMKVYDFGLSAMDEPGSDPLVPAADSRPAGNQYGFKVGIAGTYNWGVSLVNKSFLGANQGYAWTGDYYDGWPQSGSVFSMNYFGDPRQVDALSIIGTGTIDAPEIPGDGAWSTWTFAYNADMTVTVENSGITPEQTSAAVELGITGVYLSGGRLHATVGLMVGVLIDDIEIVDYSGTAVCNPGDADGDLDVDLDDFVILKNNFGTTTGADCSTGDFDGDGDVDLDDFVLLKNNFGTTY